MLYLQKDANVFFQEGVCHYGLKGARVTFAGKLNKIVTTGFSKRSERQFAIWNSV